MGVLLALPACSGPANPDRVTVLAAASLTEAFQIIGKDFERQNPGVSVRFSFGPSDGLAAQIQNGAPADVFASASESWMDAVQHKPGVTHRTDFVTNRLILVVPASNPAHVRSVADLARPGVKLVLAAQGVPAGDYARQVLARAAIADQALANVVSNEVDVKGVLQKVVSGDADAGMVYVTDLTPDLKGSVEGITIPSSINVIATYPIATVAGSRDPGLADQFIRYVLGPGRSVLNRLGFLPA